MQRRLALTLLLVTTTCGLEGDPRPFDSSSHRSTDTGGDNDLHDSAGDAGPVAVSPRADGAIDAWSAAVPMPEVRANHCSTAIKGYLVVLGGNRKQGGDFVRSDAVHAAAIRNDGGLIAWDLVGLLPSAVQSCSATADANYIYLVGGIYDDPDHDGKVWRASFSSNGALGTWRTIGDLPTGNDPPLLNNTGVFIRGRTLYVNGSFLPNGLDVTFTAHSRLGRRALGAWSRDDWVTGFRYAAQHVLAGDSIYIMGGYGVVNGVNEAFTSVAVASIMADGSVAASLYSADLPEPVAFGAAVTLDDYVYVIGGRPVLIGAGTGRVYSASIGDDAALGEWRDVASLPQPITNHTAVIWGDYVYVIGGGVAGEQLDSVYVARLR